VLGDLVDVLEDLVEDAFLASAGTHRSEETGIVSDVLGTAKDVILQSFGGLFDPSHPDVFLACRHDTPYQSRIDITSVAHITISVGADYGV
jgi:hypothetical protein